ncbi:hypothetical protein RHMOL_Rhmol06G0141800 [Rhododendron molle]|uniref:Uncharacterized protein n=1 Tax=Rhododendron molle TaxID=49168 RepID=A0ACC0NC77_RHOML|nr:hypothetical protein RHMOL_Rhmol06G0141800 [Rhododendron molle]
MRLGGGRARGWPSLVGDLSEEPSIGTLPEGGRARTWPSPVGDSSEELSIKAPFPKVAEPE